MIKKIVSGGQTGVDRAALDAALALGVPFTGMIPHGWIAEDRHPEWLRGWYPTLQESSSSSYPYRTRYNIEQSDMTLLIMGASSVQQHRGSLLTPRTARSMHRPIIVSNGRDVDRVVREINRIAMGLEDSGGVTLNVAGPRLSGYPGIDIIAYQMMVMVILADQSVL
jgi:hypothetical protein